MTQTRSIYALLGIAMLSLSAGCSTMQSGGSQAAKPTQAKTAGSTTDATQVDRNGDRLISKEEAAALPALAQDFDKIDANRDGLLDQAEIGAYHHSMMGGHHANMEARFKQADTDGDGALTLAEAKAGRVIPVVHHFDQLDADKNGKVSMEELASGRMSHGGHGKQGMQCGGHAMGSEKQGMQCGCCGGGQGMQHKGTAS